MIFAATFYDELAPHYSELSKARRVYLEAVENMIVERAKSSKRSSLLDVGAGDGRRSLRIVDRLRIHQATLVEPSREMFKLIPKDERLSAFNLTLESVDFGDSQFDVVTSLWNVLGHVPEPSRVDFLRRLGALCSSSGVIFLDVNNRHNRKAYGSLRVLFRRVLDYILPNTARGDAKVTWDFDGRQVQGTGHLFTPQEMRNLIEAAGLQIVAVSTVDYCSGVSSSTLFEGQLFYELKPRGR